MAIEGSESFYTQQALNLVKNVGLQALSTALPREFEWYMIAIELADFEGNTIDYLTFPIMPNSLAKVEQNRNTLKKSMSGVTVLSNSSLALGELILQGNFGRGFKILVGVGGNSETSGAMGWQYSIKNKKTSLYSLSSGKDGSVRGVNINIGAFDAAVKTGYGVIKILQAIIDKSVGTDNNGKPFRLFFYNLAFGESYQVIVPPNGVRFYQDMSNNMIWCYDLRFTIVAPLEAIAVAKKKQWLQLASSAIQGGVDVAASAVEDGIGSATTAISRAYSENKDEKAKELEEEM